MSESGRDERSLDERIGRIESDIEEIRWALWQISDNLEAALSAPRVSRKAPPRPEPSQPQPPAPGAARVTPTAGGREAMGPSPGGAPQPRKPFFKTKRAAPEPAGAGEAPVPAQPRPRQEIHAPRAVLKPQFWFTVIGVVLVLLGIVFLYKYSVDQGWITSPMKVAFGMALGAILLGLGLFLHGRQRFFSQMLMGAGIAAFYISGFAAFQLYDLIPYPVAVTWMGAVTLVAFVLSVQQDDQVLALVGTIGGLATPFLLHQGVDSRTGIVVYAGAVLLGSVAVYFYRGWRPLLWVSVIGGWLTLLFIYVQDMPHYGGLTAADKRAMQAGVIFAALLFWAVPLLREVLSVVSPERWRRPPAISGRKEFSGVESVADRHLLALSISTPFISLFFTRVIWHLSSREWGWVTLGVAAVFGLAFLALRNREELRQLAYTHVLVDLALVTMAISLILESDARFTALAAEALALQLAAWKLKDRFVQFIAHGAFLVMGLWLFERLAEFPVHGRAALNPAALSELFLILAAGGVSFLLREKVLRQAYQLAAYVALLAWFLRELSVLPNGQAYVTVAWGASAIGLLAAGILLRDNGWRVVALVTLFVVVGKLLLVDLAMVKAIWRVLLLVGFGATFLVLSYFFQSLWKPELKSGGGSPQSTA